MSLVAYGNSDSSEFEDDDNENASVVTLNKNVEVSEPLISEPETQAPTKVDESNREHEPSLFNLLPQPTNKKPAVIEEDDEFLHKKDNIASVVKQKAKITVPSLSDFKDVDNTIPTSKPKASNGKKSGLLSMLPQPKNVLITTKSLIPHILTQKPNNVKKKPLQSPLKKPKLNPNLSKDSDDSDNDDEVHNDFFSINKPIDIPAEDITLDIDQKPSPISYVELPSSQKVTPDIQSYFKQDIDENDVEMESETNNTTDKASSSYSSSYEAPASSNNEAVLDEEAILKLCGSRGKRRREEIQIVDVNQQEVLAEAREWLLKGLMEDTSKRVSASKKKGNEPTSQQKRKHQITYLAHQAKANEVELQNQWANNRMSKRQTQSKYGF